MDRNSC